MTSGDLFLDRDREVWRRVHSGDLVRLTVGGYISPPRRRAWVEQQHGPLSRLAPADPPTFLTLNDTPTDPTTRGPDEVMDTVTVYTDAAGGYRWHRKAPNGEIISSGEAHTRWSDAQRAAERANQDTNWTYDARSRGDG